MYKTLMACLVMAFSFGASAVDCVDCHAPIPVADHVEMEANLSNCNDCHGFADAHELDVELHTPDLTIEDCASCHGVEE